MAVSIVDRRLTSVGEIAKVCIDSGEDRMDSETARFSSCFRRDEGF